MAYSLNDLERSLPGSGTLALINNAVALALNGQYANAVFQITGTWSGTLIFEASNDNFATEVTTVNAIRAGNNTNSQTVVDSANNDLYRLSVAGFGAVRLRANTALTGAAVVTAFASAKTSGVFLNLPIPAGANSIGNIGAISSDVDTTATGTLSAAAQTVILSTAQKAAAAVIITGTWVGTITFEGTVDGTNWNPINAVAAATSQPQPTTTANSLYRLTPSGLLQIRANMTAFTSGSAVISMRGSMGTGGIFANQILPVTVSASAALFKGRASTFRTPGRAGTTGQKIMSIHNATGSTINLKVKKATVDIVQTVVKAVTVLPPIIRIWKVTVLPTNGTALSKIKIGGSSTSSASITVLGDASADGTGSATTLAATLPAGSFISQEYAPRLITAAGYEMADRLEFLADTEVILGALEGIVVYLDYTLATQNPTTDQWIAGIEWEEN